VPGGSCSSQSASDQEKTIKLAVKIETARDPITLTQNHSGKPKKIGALPWEDSSALQYQGTETATKAMYKATMRNLRYMLERSKCGGCSLKPIRHPNQFTGR